MYNNKLSKEFWEKLRNPPEYNDFEISIVTKIICGGDLSDFDEDKLYLLLYDMALTNKLGENDFKSKIKKLNQSIPNFLIRIKEISEEAESNASKIFEYNKRLLERSLTKPKFGSEWDSDDVLNFIKKLEKDIYSFSDAERLLKPFVTRQTLAIYAKEGTHDIVTVKAKKSEYITKESIIKFYRKKWEEKYGDWLSRMEKGLT